jgi:hypothetical protein
VAIAGCDEQVAHHQGLEQALSRRRAGGSQCQHTANARRAANASVVERASDGVDGRQLPAENAFQGLLPGGIVNQSREVEHCLEAIGTPNTFHEDETFGQQASSPRTAAPPAGVRRHRDFERPESDSIELEENGSERPRCHTTGRHHRRTGSVERRDTLRSIAVDATTDPPPLAGSLSPAQLPSVEAALGRLVRREEVSQRSTPARVVQ